MSILHGVWTGTMPISLAAINLPAGVAFADNGNGTYTLSGAFPELGIYTYSVVGTNAFGVTNSGGHKIIGTVDTTGIDNL